MYLPIDTSKAREREAQNTRNNRLAIVKALAGGEISRRAPLGQKLGAQC